MDGRILQYIQVLNLISSGTNNIMYRRFFFFFFFFSLSSASSSFFFFFFPQSWLMASQCLLLFRYLFPLGLILWLTFLKAELCNFPPSNVISPSTPVRELFTQKVKPWSNGVPSSRKLRTWVYLWLRLARTCVLLRWLAMTCAHLSPGQTDRQVVASGRKLNLRRDLRWVAKRTRKFPRKYTQVAKKGILRQTILYFIG